MNQMSQSQPAMTLKLLSLRRSGEDLPSGTAEISIAMTVTGARLPVSGTMTFLIPDSELQDYLQNGVNQPALRAVSAIHQTFDYLQRQQRIPTLE